MEDLLFLKARAFTDTEVVALGQWLRALEVGKHSLAKDVLDAGLMAEHYRSLLHEDPAQITPAQSAQLVELLNRLDELVRQV